MRPCKSSQGETIGRTRHEDDEGSTVCGAIAILLTCAAEAAERSNNVGKKIATGVARKAVGPTVGVAAGKTLGQRAGRLIGRTLTGEPIGLGIGIILSPTLIGPENLDRDDMGGRGAGPSCMAGCHQIVPDRTGEKTVDGKALRAALEMIVAG